MFFDTREKISSKKWSFHFIQDSLSILFLLPIYIFFFLLGLFSLPLWVSHCFPKLVWLLHFAFHPFRLTSFPPTLAPCISYFHVFFLSSLPFLYFFLSPFHFSFITCLFLLAPSHRFLSYNFCFFTWMKFLFFILFHPLHSVFLHLVFFCHLPDMFLVFLFLPFLLCSSLSCHLLWILPRVQSGVEAALHPWWPADQQKSD